MCKKDKDFCDCYDDSSKGRPQAKKEKNTGATSNSLRYLGKDGGCRIYLRESTIKEHTSG